MPLGDAALGAGSVLAVPLWVSILEWHTTKDPVDKRSQILHIVGSPPTRMMY